MQPATHKQIERIRELAAEPEISPAARAEVLRRVEAGLTVEQAYRIIKQLGRRIAEQRFWAEQRIW